MDFLEYPGMSCEVRGGMSPGLLKLTDEKIQFTHNKSGKKESVKAEEVEMVNWQRLAGGWGIRMFTKDGNLYRFAGFKEAERERVAKHFSSNFNLDMLDRYLSDTFDIHIQTLTFLFSGSCLSKVGIGAPRVLMGTS